MRQRPRRLSPIGSSESESPGRDRWLLSYADFMTLLLALFVVLYASARVDATRDASLFEGLQAAFLFKERSPSPIPTDTRPKSEQPSTQESIVPIPFLAQLEGQINELVERLPQTPSENPGIQLHQSERGLVISLASAEFFPAGGVEIPEGRREVLAAMAPLLAANTASLQFEGHTDDQPVKSGPYPSNWELSAARAAAVARLFIEEHGIDPARIAATGFAEFRPMTPNTDALARAQNRRVEIIVLEDGIVIPSARNSGGGDELDQLLEGLPPIPPQVDESLRPRDPGPPPPDIPLP